MLHFPWFMLVFLSKIVRKKPLKPCKCSGARAADIPTVPRCNGRRLWGYAPACCGRLCESVPSSTLAVRCLYVTKDGSPTHRPASPDGASTPRLKQEAACYVRDAFTLSLGVVLARARAQAGEAVTREAESAMFLSEWVGPRRPVCL